MSPRVRPQLARLVEALPALGADEVSLAGLRPERPWVARGAAGGGRGTIINLSDVPWWGCLGPVTTSALLQALLTARHRGPSEQELQRIETLSRDEPGAKAGR